MSEEEQPGRLTRMRNKAREFDIESVWKKMDMFGVALPAFNIRGTTETNTVFGGVASFVMLSIFFIYSTIKLEHLLSKYNPDVSEVTELNFYNQNERLKFGNFDFRIAFSIEGYSDKKPKTIRNL